MRIIIDAMGGDNAPAEIVKGAVMAAEEFGVEITLVGDEEKIRKCLEEQGTADDDGRFTVVHASQVIEMEDDPSTAVRSKKDSSMAVALHLLADGEGDACVSAGSTGALLTGATLIVKRIRGIRRAALAPVLPNGKNGVVLIDCGATAECTPEYLLQFAYMGSFYAKNILGCSSARVALLNVGAEETKGGELQRETYALLKNASDEGRMNFIGNAEGRDLLSGDMDVMVSDGFSGNVLLKGTEGTIKFLMAELKSIFKSNLLSKLAAAMVYGKFKALKKKMDVSEVGGTAMLGISKPVIKAHGDSDARAVRSAVRQAIAFINADVIGEIERSIEYMKLEK